MNEFEWEWAVWASPDGHGYWGLIRSIFRWHSYLEKVHHPHQIHLFLKYLAHLYLIQLDLFLPHYKNCWGATSGIWLVLFVRFILNSCDRIHINRLLWAFVSEHQHCYTADQLLKLHVSGIHEYDAELASLVHVWVPFLRKSAASC